MCLSTKYNYIDKPSIYFLPYVLGRLHDSTEKQHLCYTTWLDRKIVNVMSSNTQPSFYRYCTLTTSRYNLFSNSLSTKYYIVQQGHRWSGQRGSAVYGILAFLGEKRIQYQKSRILCDKSCVCCQPWVQYRSTLNVCKTCITQQRVSRTDPTTTILYLLFY